MQKWWKRGRVMAKNIFCKHSQSIEHRIRDDETRYEKTGAEGLIIRKPNSYYYEKGTFLKVEV